MKTHLGLAILLVLIANAPIYWIINTALMPEYALRSFPPRFFPTSPQWGTFVAMLQNTDILRWLANSMLIGLIVIAVSLAISIPGGYSLSRYKYRTTHFIGLTMLVSQMLPATLLSIPLFIMMKTLQLTTFPLGSVTAVVISHATLVIPFMVWMLKGYFDTIPIEIEQSAWIDGCSSLKTVWSIVMPLARPGIAASALYGFVLSWNDFIFSKSFLASSKPLWTISLGIAGFRGEFVTPWNQVMAASLLSAVPLFIVIILLQKHFVSGLTSGSVK